MAEKKDKGVGLISANEAGKMLGVSGKTVIRMMEDGDFPGYKIGNAWKFKPSEIEEYIEQQKFHPKQNSDM